MRGTKPLRALALFAFAFAFAMAVAVDASDRSEHSGPSIPSALSLPPSYNITGPLNSFMEQVEQLESERDAARPVVQLPSGASAPDRLIPMGQGSQMGQMGQMSQMGQSVHGDQTHQLHPMPFPDHLGPQGPFYAAQPQSFPHPLYPLQRGSSTLQDPGLQRLINSFAGHQPVGPIPAPGGIAGFQPIVSIEASALPPFITGDLGLGGSGGVTTLTISYVTCHVGCSHVTSIVNNSASSTASIRSAAFTTGSSLLILVAVHLFLF
jgi:hypothetical protein